MRYLLFFASNLLCSIVLAQSIDFTDPSKRLTPSPVVSSLGSYGSLDLKKSTGGIHKNIELFQLKQGNISYTPLIEYFSTGVKINDWGGRLGVGWGDTFSGVIYRTVRTIPDELDAQRVEPAPETLSEYSQECYDYVNSVHLSTLGGAYRDSEYDLFSFSFFGNSGTFIIKNNEPILLNHQEGTSIKILATTPYKFCLIASDGTQYHFTDTETTGYINDNSCDEGATYMPAQTTAWFLNLVVSPFKDTIQFLYEPIHYEYFYDYSESYTLKNRQEPGDDNICVGAEGNSEYYFEYNYKNCIRKKWTTTKYLTSVSSDGFRLNFDYEERTDLPGEKLFKQVDLFDYNDNKISHVKFEYDKYVSVAPVEFSLHTFLQPFEEEELKTRYFLKYLEFGTAASLPEKRYIFSYYDPANLPHRFSFSQDLAGYYNGKNNAAFIPEDKAQEYIESKPNAYLHLFDLNLGDRSISATLSKVGMLKEIVHPTAGTDLITYESNSYTKTVEEFIPAEPVTGSFVNNDPSHQSQVVSQTFSVPFLQDAEFQIYTRYAVPNFPYENDGSVYWIEMQLWNATTNSVVPLPNSRPSDFKVVLKLFEQYINKVTLSPSNDYELRFDLFGEQSTIDFIVESYSAINYVDVDVPFFGQRVKQIVTDAQHSAKITRTFNYRKFVRNTANTISFLANTSANLANELNGYGSEMFAEVGVECDPGTSSPPMPLLIRLHQIRSASLFDINIFQGSPISYSHVTELLGEAEASFTASEFFVMSDEEGGRLLGDYLPFLPNSNPGWKGGLESKRYLGVFRNGGFAVKKELAWNYSIVGNPTQIFFSYVVQKKYEPLSPAEPPYYENMLKPFSVAVYGLHTKWYALQSATEITYPSDINNLEPLSSTVTYKYSPSDKLLLEQETNDSKGATILTRYKRPKSMVESDLDPNQVYQQMVENNILEPVIEKQQVLNGSILTTVRTNYYSPHPDLYVPLLIEKADKDNPYQLVVQFLTYDNSGNVTSLVGKDGILQSYIYGYENEHVVATIKGLGLNDIEGVLGVPIVLQGENGQNLSAAQISQLRAAFPDSFINTYTYKPLIGMTSMTDINKLTTYYEYDPFSRLSRIRNNDHEIIQAFEYNYKSHE